MLMPLTASVYSEQIQAKQLQALHIHTLTDFTFRLKL